MMTADEENLIAVGLVWSATKALMSRGALIWDQAVKKRYTPTDLLKFHHKLFIGFKNWVGLQLIWQYSIPFLLNISVSATFIAILGHTSILLAVPVTNATTFAATAFVGMLLGEKTRVGFTLLGMVLIVLGIWLYVST